MGQFDLFGVEHKVVPVGVLSDAQNEILRHIGTYGHIRALTAGAILH